jgi:hypothetical protein
MNNQVPPYETVYGVQFFDDIHNYLPELLYNPGRFESVPQLLYYLQRQTMTRFNLFQQGRNSFFQQSMADSMPPPMYTANPFRAATPVFSGAPMRHTAPPFGGGASGGGGGPTASGSGPTDGARTDDAILLSPLLSLLRAMNTPLTATFRTTVGGRAFEDIPVRPSRAQIQAASRVSTGPPATQNGVTLTTPPTCAICQDSIIQNESCREFIVCGHLFHRNCIDQWLQQNVRCPVCRHDIRNIPATASVQQGTNRSNEHPENDHSEQ